MPAPASGPSVKSLRYVLRGKHEASPRWRLVNDHEILSRHVMPEAFHVGGLPVR
jgi:hypothetical protein